MMRVIIVVWAIAYITMAFPVDDGEQYWIDELENFLAENPEGNAGNPEETEGFFEGDMIIPRGRNAILGNHKYWKDGVVPYTIDSAAKYNSQEMGYLNEAIETYNRYTCVRWVPRTNQASYVIFKRLNGCYSNVGKVSNSRAQTISISTGCFRNKKGSIVHEMMHAIGFYHEQSRADRDDYVTIMLSNIRDGKAGNFRKYTLKQIHHLGAPYDYGSIMHYSTMGFSKNRKPTIVVRQPGKTIGQRKDLSAVDIFKINKLYNCSAKGYTTVLPNWTPTPAGGYPTVIPGGTEDPVTLVGRPCNTKTILSSDWKCTFDTGLCNMCDVPSMKQEWKHHRGPTSSSKTGPDTDHTTGRGYYMYLETSQGSQGDQAGLQTPLLKLSGSYCVGVWLNMYGASMGSVSLKRANERGTPESTIWTVSGDQGRGWFVKYAQMDFKSGSTYRLQMIATRGSSFTGDAAFDDISIARGACPSVPGRTPVPKVTPKVTPAPTISQTSSRWACSFERDFCGMKIGGTTQWRRYQSATPSQGTGPSRPHTGTYFAYIEASGTYEKRTTLSTPYMTGHKEWCLSFWYSMYGRDMGTLSVSGRQRNGMTFTVFTRTGDQGQQWHHWQRAITTTADTQLVFTGMTGKSFQSDIAIDDILMTPGACPTISTSPPTIKTTANPNPLVGTAAFACSFEGNWCGFINDTKQRTTWRMHHGPTPSRNTGPTAANGGNGLYAYIEASNRMRGDKARMTSPSISLPKGGCLEFYYHMYGADTGELNIFTRLADVEQEIWSKKGQQGNNWLRARVPLKPSAGFQLVFESIVGKLFRSDIAIDDIRVASGSC